MASTATGTAEPIEAMLGGGDHSVCPQCEHERSDPRFRLSVWVAHRLGMRPPHARCDINVSSTESLSGMPGPCNCGNVFHQS